MELWTDIGILFLKAVIVVVLVMTIAGYSVMGERKVASWVQGRVGPNRTTIPWIAAIPFIGRALTRIGLFQLPADGGKFLFKEEPIPGHVNKFYYILAPMLSFIPAMTILAVIPFGQYTTDEGVVPVALTNIDVGMLFILAVSSLGVYGLILAGWSANSKYPFLGGVRASAQMISYELTMGLSLLPVFMWMGDSLNLFDVVREQGGVWWGFIPKWTIIYQPLSALLFLVALFAETNRLPFDMPESETDLVAGYNTEYGAFKFGLFFIGEYAHVLIGSMVFCVLFLGGWSIPFFTLDAVFPAGVLGALLSVLVLTIKALSIVFFFMWIRWTLPRFRYDQIMNLGWTVLLPLAIANFVAYLIVIAIVTPRAV
jgi:NADH-quinone oxidoreductase subunit H